MIRGTQPQETRPMRIERALAIRNNFKSRLTSLYAHATHFGLSSDEINASYGDLRADTPQGTPSWVWAYLDGYRQALTDALYRDHLIFGGFIDGVFYSTHSDRPDYYQKHGIDPVDYADDGRVTNRGHYWDRYLPVKGGTYDRGAFKPFYT